jgi:hypothetical protein
MSNESLNTIVNFEMLLFQFALICPPPTFFIANSTCRNQLNFCLKSIRRTGIIGKKCGGTYGRKDHHRSEGEEG